MGHRVNRELDLMVLIGGGEKRALSYKISHNWNTGLVLTLEISLFTMNLPPKIADRHFYFPSSSLVHPFHLIFFINRDSVSESLQRIVL
jgi:hypothetical protein